MSTNKRSIGIVGARGHTGTELIWLVAAHPQLELAFVSSRELDGQPVLVAAPVSVPGDLSLAGFALVAALLVPG